MLSPRFKRIVSDNFKRPFSIQSQRKDAIARFTTIPLKFDDYVKDIIVLPGLKGGGQLILIEKLNKSSKKWCIKAVKNIVLNQ